MVGTCVKKLAIVAVALSIALVGCGPNNGSSSPAQQTGANSSETGTPTGTGPVATLGVATGLEQNVYYLATDSSGTKPTEGTKVMLLFEPGGRAVLYAVSPTDALGHHGTWTYASGTLAVKFAAEDFHPDASFVLDLTQDTVTMPFQVFSTDQGTSTWQRGALSLVSMAEAIFAASAVDQDIANLTADQAVDEAYQVVSALAGQGDNLQDDIATTGELGLTLAAWHMSRPMPLGQAASAPKIKSVTKVVNGVKIEFEDAPTVEVSLYNWAEDPTTPVPLTEGPIAGDPRVRLDPQSPHNGAADAPNKTAVFISPFENGLYYGSVWVNLLVPDAAAHYLSWDVGSHHPSRGFDWPGMQTKLGKHGYNVNSLMNGSASLVGIIEALGGKSGRAPGYVIVNTHGMSDGSLATGVDLGKVGDTATVDAAWNAALATLAPAGVGDLLTFDGGTAASPKTISKMALPREATTGVSDYFLSITPAFWKWLASKGATMSQSLVYMAVCLSDATPALREAIDARAYFAWAQSVNPYMAGSVASYLVDDLIRPTRSAEEAFYNIFRIISTRSEIYDEDSDFEQAIPVGVNKGVKFLDFFHGWSWDGHSLLPYSTSGWLDRKMNPGSVWWMVFAARWDKEAAAGAAKLVNCYNTYWKDGKPGGVADTFCNSANSGGTPTTDEVAYATYLLTGTQLMPYSRTVVPRYTLNDAA